MVVYHYFTDLFWVPYKETCWREYRNTGEGAWMKGGMEGGLGSGEGGWGGGGGVEKE